MPHDPKTVDQVVYEYKRLNRSPFRVSKATGIPVHIVWAIIEENEPLLTSQKEYWGGEGRPELREFTVARRRVSAGQWDNEEPAIAQARADYEAGIIDMATGRDGGWLILYAFPRKKRDPRPCYFELEVS